MVNINLKDKLPADFVRIINNENFNDIEKRNLLLSKFRQTLLIYIFRNKELKNNTKNSKRN
jgi:hypothetical protein